MNRPTMTITVMLALATAYAASPALAQEDAGGPTLTVESGPAEFGDYGMKVSVTGVDLVPPENLTGTEQGKGYLQWLHNREPADRDAWDSSPSANAKTEFRFDGIGNGDTVGVELLKADGSSHDPPIVATQRAVATDVIIKTSPPSPGNHFMDITDLGFDAVSLYKNHHLGHVPGEGHYQFLLNGELAPSPEGEPWVVSNTPFAYYNYEGLEDGDVVAVQLVGHTNQTFDPNYIKSQRVGSGPAAYFTSAEPRPCGHTLSVRILQHEGQIRWLLNGENVTTNSETSHAYTNLTVGDVLGIELVDTNGAPLEPRFVSTTTVQPPNATSDEGGWTVSSTSLQDDLESLSCDTGQGGGPGDDGGATGALPTPGFTAALVVAAAVVGLALARRRG